MIPPYDPEHVESVVQWHGQRDVVAVCSCTGHIGRPHRLGDPETCRAIIADFNAHRETYAAVPV